MRYKREDVMEKSILRVAEEMIIAAVTAPKGHGYDTLETLILTGEAKFKLAEHMREVANKFEVEFYKRDAVNVEKAYCIVLLAAKSKPLGFNKCILCNGGCAKTAELGNNCNFTIVDLGIATGSAVSVAADHRVDNRVMFSAGDTAIKMGLFSESVGMCLGIPLYASAKNIFFDRNPNRA